MWMKLAQNYVQWRYLVGPLAALTLRYMLPENFQVNLM